MKYYLMDSKKEDRFIIDSITHHGCSVEQTTEARSWIQSKKNFGFDLTVDQIMLLEDQCKALNVVL